MKLSIFSLLCFCIAGSVSVCHGSEAVRIAAVFAKTGTASIGNAKHFQGVQLAVEELNADGGLLGKSVEVVEIDNKSTPLGSKDAAKQAIQADVIAVIGASFSSHSLAMAPVLQEAKIPMIASPSSNPAVTQQGDYIFRVCNIDSFQGQVIANFAFKDLKAKTAVILTNVSSSYSSSLAEVFRQQFKKLGASILWEGDYLQEATDFSDLLKRVKELSPEVILLPGYDKDSALVIKQARSLGISAVFLGGDGWNERMYDYAGSSLHGNYFCDEWHPDSPLEKSRKFVQAFLKRFGEKKNLGGVSSYDAVMLLADAVRRAGSFEQAQIRDALAATKNFQGATGKICFDENRNPAKPAVIIKFQDGTSVFVKNVEP